MTDIEIVLNGEPKRVPAGSLADLLSHLSLDPRTVVVELVHFVGGG